jgi:hypothetical protein
MPAAVLDERSLALIKDSREVSDVGWPGRDRKVDQQEAQNRLDANATGGHVDAAVNRPGRDVEVWMTAQAQITEAVRVPVPADHFPARVIEEVIPIRGRAHTEVLPAVLDDSELMAEHELDGADSGGGEA